MAVPLFSSIGTIVLTEPRLRWRQMKLRRFKEPHVNLFALFFHSPVPFLVAAHFAFFPGRVLSGARRHFFSAFQPCRPSGFRRFYAGAPLVRTLMRGRSSFSVAAEQRFNSTRLRPYM